MSNIKKNKGRDPSAQENDPPATRLVQKFIEMIEVNYIRNVVIPVLEAEGLKPIDFHHGQTEVGKDLIFYRSKAFGKKSLVVAVVKTGKLTKSSSDISGLPVILVQVDQAKRNEVINWDGAKQRPDEILVILADDPSHDVITSNPSGFQDRLAEGVEFILGTHIANSLLEHRPDIAEQILESKIDTSGFLGKHPTNLPLLHALHSSELVDIKSIFTDLDAAVGTTTIAHALSLRPSGTSRVEISDAGWSSASQAIREIAKNLGSILVEPLDAVESNYLKINQKALSPRNKKILADLNKVAIDMANWIETVLQDIEGRQAALNSLSNDLIKLPLCKQAENSLLEDAIELCNVIKNGAGNVSGADTLLLQQEDVSGDIPRMYDELTKFCNVLEIANNKIGNLVKTEISVEPIAGILTVLLELKNSIERIYADAQHFTTTSNKTLGYAKRFVPIAKHVVVFDVDKFRNQLDAYLENLIFKFRSSDIVNNRELSRRLLEDTHQYLCAIDSFTSATELSSVLKPDQAKIDSDPHLGACILGLLNSGVNVLVTGNAGSGKSTTLEMFARQQFEKRGASEEVIFLPLAKFAMADISLLTAKPLESFYDEVSRLFRVTQPGVTSKFVKEKIAHSNRLILILDGIDEASGLVAWILKLIEELRKLKGDGLQIVASSRFGDAQLEEAGLFRIQLLPFRREQVIRFISNFLSNAPELASEVIEHLNCHPAMFAVAQTPLMSTILCILAQNGVVLPETKSALYKERFDLLWGSYDAKKQVHRVKSSKACLEEVSKKSAFYLHSHYLRSDTRKNILTYVQESLTRKFRPEVIRVALDELERPCNVLLEEVDGTIGFGHLSYQEYLVSDELYTNRSTDIVVHLSDPWWRGVLVLVAMKSEDIGSIIEQRIMDSGDIGSAKKTLMAMIEVTNASQRKILQGFLREHNKLDFLVDLDDEDNIYDSY